MEPGIRPAISHTHSSITGLWRCFKYYVNHSGLASFLMESIATKKWDKRLALSLPLTIHEHFGFACEWSCFLLSSCLDYYTICWFCFINYMAIRTVWKGVYKAVVGCLSVFQHQEICGVNSLPQFLMNCSKIWDTWLTSWVDVSDNTFHALCFTVCRVITSGFM